MHEHRLCTVEAVAKDYIRLGVEMAAHCDSLFQFCLSKFLLTYLLCRIW